MADDGGRIRHHFQNGIGGGVDSFWRKKCKQEERIAATWESVAWALAEDVAASVDGIDGQHVTAKQVIESELAKRRGKNEPTE